MAAVLGTNSRTTLAKSMDVNYVYDLLISDFILLLIKFYLSSKSFFLNRRRQLFFVQYTTKS